jgi:hypothetical protein
MTKKRYWRPGREYIDQNKVRVKREARARLSLLLNTENEPAFVAAVKSWKPDVTDEELKEFIELYRASVREKQEQRRSRS